MTPEESCCTCASLLSDQQEQQQPFTEKEKPAPPSRAPRLLPCCNRYICASCLSKNPRFESYCPFCQITSGPSRLPQGLRDPPAYSSALSSPQRHLLDSKDGLQHPEVDDTESDGPPAYSAVDTLNGPLLDEADGNVPAPDVTHHLHPSDTLASISLAYSVPVPILRRHNSLYSDSLLHGRRTLSIPGSHYKGGVSLSPKPVESEEERERKAKLRRFMVAVKCHEYDLAELYLKNAKGDLEGALQAWREDEKWEKENPLNRKRKEKMRGGRRGVSGGLTDQLLGR